MSVTETTASKLRYWGIVEISDDQQGARIETIIETAEARVVHQRTRPSFTTECFDCGDTPHVCPDDHAMAVCLHCGRDKWL